VIQVKPSLQLTEPIDLTTINTTINLPKRQLPLSPRFITTKPSSKSAIPPKTKEQAAVQRTVETSVNQIGGFIKTASGVLQMAGAPAFGLGVAHKVLANAPRSRGVASILLTTSIAALGFDAFQAGVKQMVLNKAQASVKDQILEHATDQVVKPQLIKLGLSEKAASTVAHGTEILASISLSLPGSSGGFHLIEGASSAWMNTGRQFNHLPNLVTTVATQTATQRGLGFMLAYGGWEAFEHLGVPALSNPSIQQAIAHRITQHTTKNS
jgi:hypothetical protein